MGLQGAEDKSVKWETLEHSGVLFPPEYTPHGVKMLYDGQPVDLTPQQEEVQPRLSALHKRLFSLPCCLPDPHAETLNVGGF